MISIATRFIFIGLINTLIGYVLGLIVFLSLELETWVSFVVSGFATSLVSYILHKNLVFFDPCNQLIKFLKYLIMQCASIVSVASVNYFLVDVLLFSAYGAHAFSLAVAATVSFFILSKFVFTVNYGH